MNYVNPATATDLLLKHLRHGTEGLVLVERSNPPYGLALPGGYLENGLRYSENAIKEGEEETGLAIRLIDPPDRPYTTRSTPGRDSRGAVNTIVYRAWGDGQITEGPHSDARAVHHLPYETLRDLLAKERQNFAFDHADILEEFLREEEP